LILALLLGIVPAGLLAVAGSSLHPSRTGEGGKARWLMFLLGGLTLLLAILAGSALIGGPAYGFTLVALTPSICGALAALLIQLGSDRTAWRHNPARLLRLVIAIVALYITIAIAGDRMLVVLQVIGGAGLALLWQSWRWYGKALLATSLILGILLILSLWVTIENQPLFEKPDWLSRIASIALFLVPGAGVILAARLVYTPLAGEFDQRWLKYAVRRRLIASLVVAAGILLLVSYQIVTASIWDAATDGLAGIYLTMLTCIASIAGAILLYWSLKEWRKRAARIFDLVVPLAMIGAFGIGWSISPVTVTERRAETVNRAILRYYQKNNGYPETLSELRPWYLPVVLGPVIIPGQTWCYEGGQDYYRLGYVYRKFFSAPAMVRVHAAVGMPPDPAWECEDEAAKYPAPAGFYGSP